MNRNVNAKHQSWEDEEMKFQRLLSVCVVAIALLVSTNTSRAADEMVDNPQYAGWSKFKAGTSVKYAQNTVAMGQTTNGEITMTLIAITPEKATIQTKMSMMMNGKNMDMPAQQLDIPAKVTKAEAKETGEPAGSANADTKQGTERIEVAGKSYDCKWTQVTSEQNNMKAVAKTWLSDEVPGKMVKMEATTTGQANSTTKMTLASIETK
jgi:hypothetical protein